MAFCTYPTPHTGLPANIDSLVGEVRAIFGDFSIPFTQACLTHYAFEPQRVISAVLEQQLPKHLTDLQAREKLERKVSVGNVNSGKGDDQSKLLDNDVDEYVGGE